MSDVFRAPDGRVFDQDEAFASLTDLLAALDLTAASALGEFLRVRCIKREAFLGLAPVVMDQRVESAGDRIRMDWATNTIRVHLVDDFPLSINTLDHYMRGVSDAARRYQRISSLSPLDVSGVDDLLSVTGCPDVDALEDLILGDLNRYDRALVSNTGPGQLLPEGKVGILFDLRAYGELRCLVVVPYPFSAAAALEALDRIGDFVADDTYMDAVYGFPFGADVDDDANWGDEQDWARRESEDVQPKAMVPVIAPHQSPETPACSLVARRPHALPALVAGAMLFFALGDLPYGYYTLLRWVVLIAALLCLYVIIEDGVKDWFDMALVGTFGAIALLFNPILPVYLSRQVWRLPDLMAGVLFILSSYILVRKPTVPASSATDPE